jgi:Skp family chaperone for outer membrane proteins
MKSLCKFVAAAFVFAAFLGINAIAARAQTAAAQSKIAIIDSGAFADEKQGIQRIVAGMKRVDAEFAQRRQELQNLQARYNQILEDIKKLQQPNTPVDQNTIQQKADQADQLKKEIERKYQDANEAYQKRMNEMMNPLRQDVAKQLEAYAKQRGITVIIDAQTPGVLYVDGSSDITADFIREYNQKNPANTASNAKP